jgi:hypothetical protein
MTALKALVFSSADLAEAAFKNATAEIDAIELRRAAAEAYSRYTAMSAVLDRRYGPARRR